MKKLFTSPDPSAVRTLAAFLEQHGIKISVLGEARLGAAGGLAPTDCWPEIALLQDGQEQEAKELIRQYSSSGATKEPWICPTCGENFEGQFTDC